MDSPWGYQFKRPERIRTFDMIPAKEAYRLQAEQTAKRENVGIPILEVMRRQDGTIDWSSKKKIGEIQTAKYS